MYTNTLHVSLVYLHKHWSIVGVLYFLELNNERDYGRKQLICISICSQRVIRISFEELS